MQPFGNKYEIEPNKTGVRAANKYLAIKREQKARSDAVKCAALSVILFVSAILIAVHVG